MASIDWCSQRTFGHGAWALSPWWGFGKHRSGIARQCGIRIDQRECQSQIESVKQADDIDLADEWSCAGTVVATCAPLRKGHG